MTEWDVRGWVLALTGALDSGDESVTQEAALNLLEGHLLMQVRIVELLEDIRQNGAEQMRATK